VFCVWRITTGPTKRVLVAVGFAALLVAFAMHVAGLDLLRPIGYTTYVY
jgi:hypothetical protein